MVDWRLDWRSRWSSAARATVRTPPLDRPHPSAGTVGSLSSKGEKVRTCFSWLNKIHCSENTHPLSQLPAIPLDRSRKPIMPPSGSFLHHLAQGCLSLRRNPLHSPCDFCHPFCGRAATGVGTGVAVSSSAALGDLEPRHSSGGFGDGMTGFGGQHNLACCWVGSYACLQDPVGLVRYHGTTNRGRAKQTWEVRWLDRRLASRDVGRVECSMGGCCAMRLQVSAWPRNAGVWRRATRTSDCWCGITARGVANQQAVSGTDTRIAPAGKPAAPGGLAHRSLAAAWIEDRSATRRSTGTHPNPRSRHPKQPHKEPRPVCRSLALLRMFGNTCGEWEKPPGVQRSSV